MSSYESLNPFPLFMSSKDSSTLALYCSKRVTRSRFFLKYAESRGFVKKLLVFDPILTSAPFSKSSWAIYVLPQWHAESNAVIPFLSL